MSRNTIDTRDLWKRQQELQDLKDTLESAEEELQEAQKALAAHDSGDASPCDETKDEEERDMLEESVGDAQDAFDAAELDFGDDERAELAELDELESEIGRGWKDGECMIPKSEFEDYVRELAEDTGAIPNDAQWPCTCIDWEQAAQELAMDYSSVTYKGTDYLVRC